MPTFRLLGLTCLLATTLTAAAQSSAITTDPPPDKANPAALVAFELPSHGSDLNAKVYVASGVGPHPVLVMFHGFPGSEQGNDIGQAVRRAGWDVLLFNYRGSWGSKGTYSFAHNLEDCLNAVAYMRDPVNAKRFRADPTKIVVLGHSMGGWMSAATLANDPKVRAAIMISGADMGGKAFDAYKTMGSAALTMGAAMVGPQTQGPLNTPAADLVKELAENGDKWRFTGYAAAMAPRPVFIFTADDGSPPAAAALEAELKKDGDKDVHVTHFATDHEYSGVRLALIQAILDDLASLKL